MIPRGVSDFIYAFLWLGGGLDDLPAIYWPTMTTATWPGHE